MTVLCEAGKLLGTEWWITVRDNASFGQQIFLVVLFRCCFREDAIPGRTGGCFGKKSRLFGFGQRDKDVYFTVAIKVEDLPPSLSAEEKRKAMATLLIVSPAFL